MNLLPKSFQEFREAEYWNKFFAQRQNRAFEWYGDYNQLSIILHKFIKPKDNILVIGCGNSKLSADLFDVGLHQITNIDVSPVVIKTMSEQHKKQRPEMSWHLMDVTKMDFKDNEFSVVLDKGTLDALLSSTTEPVIQQIHSMFNEISRVLKYGGRYVCVSLLQAHILDNLLEWFINRGWMVRVCRRLEDEEELEQENSKQRLAFPVFVVICTKFKPMPGIEPVLEAALDCETAVKIDRTKLKQSVAALQQYAILRHQISKGSIGDQDISLSLFDERSPSWRYNLHVVDWRRALASKFAIFIVPHGRESQWIFGTTQGRRQLAESAGFERLVVVHLNRDHDYVNLDTIKAELSSKVMELAPPGLSRKTLVPFLSVGEDLGKRVLVHKGISESSGEFVVEDVEGDEGRWFRRLIFTANSNIVQSESLLHLSPLKKSRKKKSTRKLIDHGYLSCQHHKYIVGSLAFLHGLLEEKPSQIKVLIVGLGGGGLPSFLHHAFDNMSIELVDIDPAMVKVAKSWFEFPVSESLTVHVADGIDYIAKAKTEGLTYDLVILDVDSKDATVGMSCPPKSFVECENLRNCKYILCKPGILVLNLVCRDSNLREETVDTIKSVFPQLYGIKVEQEVNEILYGLTVTKNIDGLKNTLSSTLNELDLSLRDVLKTKDSFFDVGEFIKSLSVLG